MVDQVAADRGLVLIPFEEVFERDDGPHTVLPDRLGADLREQPL